MSENKYPEFLLVENDIHFLILILEQIWKTAQNNENNENQQTESLQIKYRRTLMKIKSFLNTVEKPENIIFFLEEIKSEILAGVSDEAKVAIYKKLDLDFSVMLKKIKVESQVIQKISAKSPPSKTPLEKESDSGLWDMPVNSDQNYSRTDIMKMVKDTKGIKIDALRRKHAKQVLSKFIKIIREKNPQELSEKLESEFKKRSKKTDP